MTVRVRPLLPSDVAVAAQLLVSRHAAERKAEPLLPAGPADPVRARALVEATLGWPGAVGRLAEVDDSAVAFVVGAPALATSARPRSAFVAATGHAATRADALGALLAAWTSDGEQHIQVGTHDAIGEAAVAAAGFSPLLVLGVAALPLASGARVHADVRQAVDADLDDVVALARMLRTEHEHLGVSDPRAERARHRARLADLRTGVWLAHEAGAPVGMVVLEPPGAVVSPMHVPAQAIHLPDLVVTPASRGRGVGAALVGEALGWAHAIGYRHVTLHVHVGNAGAERFWHALGVRVVARQWARAQCPR
jgi:GNAT superfamily N-acetyltransferase